MRDPFSWSLPLGRLFGITIRVHVVFLVVAVGLILRWAFQGETEMLPGHKVPAGTWMDAAALMGLLFLSVLAHEFGHCFGARLMDGDAQEILLWPLGGLAAVEVPHTPRANLVTALAGPLVNLLLCVGCAMVLGSMHDPPLRPPLNPVTWYPFRNEMGDLVLSSWGGREYEVGNFALMLAARLFYVNWVLFLLNMLLIGFPMDGGRVLQCLLWPRLGFQQATVTAIYAGFITMLVVGIFAIVKNELLPMCLSAFIGFTCWRQWVILMTGGEESLLGYDFSQGYTSLERDQPAPRRRKRPNFYQRWQQ